MNSDLYKKIIEDHKELSSLPQTLSEVLKVVSNEESSATDLSSVLLKDPGLTTKILRIVNSPFYSKGREISSMNTAVMTIGLRAVSALALSTSIYDMTGKLETSIDKTRFWRRSIEVAIACREIAEAIRYGCVEEAFITGLIHDVGLLVMESSFPEKFDRIWKRHEAGENMFELEEGIWGSNHARIGRFLLEQWNIPQHIPDAVGHYYNDFASGDDNEDFLLAQILALAVTISKFPLTDSNNLQVKTAERKRILAENLNIDEDRLLEIEKSLMIKTIEEAKFLEIEIGSPDELLTEANRMLYSQYVTVESLLDDKIKNEKDLLNEQQKRSSLETLNTITATFNHYINNANASILGRAQLMNLNLERGNIVDNSQSVDKSLKAIINGVNTISAVLEELNKLTEYDTVSYHDETFIIDIENKIKEHLESIENYDVAKIS